MIDRHCYAIDDNAVVHRYESKKELRRHPYEQISAVDARGIVSGELKINKNIRINDFWAQYQYSVANKKKGNDSEGDDAEMEVLTSKGVEDDFSMHPRPFLDGFTNSELAKMVWNGDFGDGEEREIILGERYRMVQRIVNRGGKVNDNG